MVSYPMDSHRQNVSLSLGGQANVREIVISLVHFVAVRGSSEKIHNITLEAGGFGT